MVMPFEVEDERFGIVGLCRRRVEEESFESLHAQVDAWGVLWRYLGMSYIVGDYYLVEGRLCGFWFLLLWSSGRA